jgi:5'-nucleotidase
LFLAASAVVAASSIGACGGDSAAPATAAGAAGPGGESPASTSATGMGGAGGAPGDRRVVILFTSDEHSHLFAFTPELDDFPIPAQAGTGPLVGGVARRAAVIAAERNKAEDSGADSILVSAGDNQMGTLVHTAFETDSIDYGTMKSLGYDVTTFGNHEFDFGPAALAASLSAAKAGAGLPPIVATNIHFSSSSPDDDALAALYSTDVTDAALAHPYRVLTTKRGLKIGVIGYVGVDASNVAPNKVPVAFSELGVAAGSEADPSVVLPKLYADLQPVVDTLRTTEKVDLVIALAHGGVNDSSTEAGIEASDDWNVCKNVKGLDFIVSGHAHNPDPAPITVNQTGGKSCLVLNASSFGRHVGRVEFTVPGDAKRPVDWDNASQALIPVTEATAPDVTQAAAAAPLVEELEEGAYLPALLTTVTGAAVVNDPETPGDLYFHPITTTAFDVTDTHALLDLSADAMLAQSDAAGTPGDLAIESAGVIRSVLSKGKTGVVSAADAFGVVPLGASPVDGTIGYPLVRAYIIPFELRAVVEFALARGATDNDYELGFAGLKVEYDATRPLVLALSDLVDPTKGQVMRLSIDSDHSDGFEQFDTVIYDRAAGTASTAAIAVVTSSYIAQFASSADVTLTDVSGTQISVLDAILHRPSGAEYKQVEAFLTFLHASPGGALSSLYDKSSPSYTQRLVCTNGC